MKGYGVTYEVDDIQLKFIVEADDLDSAIAIAHERIDRLLKDPDEAEMTEVTLIPLCEEHQEQREFEHE